MIQRNSLLSIDHEVVKRYMVPFGWYTKYLKFKQDGPHPGKIETSSLMISKNELRPDLKENYDFIVVSSLQWKSFLKTFGTDGELIYQPHRFSFRSVSSGGYGDLTLRGDASEIALPASARRLENSFWAIASSYSQLESFESEKKKSLLSVNDKIGFEKFKECDAFNSSLQCMITIQEFVNYFVENSSTGEFSSSEFLVKLSMLCMTAAYASSSVIKSVFLYKCFESWPTSPTAIVQSIIDKIEIELGSNSLKNIFDGILNIENQCCQCDNIVSFDMRFSYLNLKPSKSVDSTIRSFLRTTSTYGFCDVCYKDCEIRKTAKIDKFPNSLIILLRRDIDDETKKNCVYKRKLKIHSDYRLAAVVTETDNKVVCFCKRNNQWYLYNNDKYSKTNFSQAFEGFSHVLLYKRYNRI